jgi:hypothetical protein
MKYINTSTFNFPGVIENDFLYVDKTAYVWKLVSGKKDEFILSRPRRFGKSLLVSTLKAVFQGRRELFKGLAIDKMDYDWKAYPVIHLDFGNCNADTSEELEVYLNHLLEMAADELDLELKKEEASIRFENLIRKAAEKSTTGSVVVLIDEYDKPILDALYTEFEQQNRQELRNFYSPLKDFDQYIRFLFITGITKVSHVNIFSGLNQLDDISLNQYYSSICGITETELEEYFEPEIKALAQRHEMTIFEAKEKLSEMYDGYHFTHDVEGVYNPFCLLKCFRENDFGSYWFESGTPSFLVKTLQNQPLELSTLVNGRQANENQFKNYDPDSKNMLPVIYQSGYLTIKGFEKDSRLYTLDFPNREIEQGFLEVLLKKFINVPYDDIGLEISNIRVALRNHDIDRLFSIIKAAIADLPTVVKKDMCENYYESVTHLIFRLTGFPVVSELQSVAGRSDIVLTTKDSVFIFELKMDKGRSFEEVVEDALTQIDKNGYADRFAVSGKEMYKAGIVFSSEGKGILGWKVKE